MARFSQITLCAGIAISLLAGSARAEMSNVRVATQIGLPYLPLIVMQHDKLWEKKAKQAGEDVTVEYAQLGGGGPLNDALLSDSIQIASAGVAPLLVLWDRTLPNYKVKALSAINASPMFILTNKPNIKSVKDFGPDDRIAVASVKVSINAIVLQMAAEQATGKWDALENIQVAMAHPEAFAALTTRSGGITGYVANSPFQDRALQVPGISKVVDSFEVQGGPASLSLIYAKSAFVKDNPKLTAAFIAAQKEAVASIKADPKGAIDKYIAVTGDKTDRGILEGLITSPTWNFDLEPKGTMKVADFIVKTGLLKHKPASWKDYFFDTVANGD
ncbi:ABC transporter substrate-binding protein [Bradyrhizobium canariense]|uniref:NitT/TauT family transport system substrate-binding protein n=1 Tax=Bradyrhizobium canariense TaxID=255045 RepID=A0A1H1WP33_9BRAD|nr:ABC transporter substrate-binding protein [Bradyrhizobium canariense]SDS99078.1 NitT/TauT family transport system substrate-binding protein [Bradyrhizobium canariense]